MKYNSYDDTVAKRLSKINAERTNSELLRLDEYSERRNELSNVLSMLSKIAPEFNIEILKKTSFLGRLAVRPSFTLSEYFSGEDSRYDTRFVIDEVVKGWHLKNVIKSPPIYDQISYNIESLTIASDGRNWLSPGSSIGLAFGSDVPTIGVIGENGRYLESQEIHLQSPDAEIYVMGNLSAVISGLKNIQNK